jgi:hypothetical protein
MMNKQTTKSHYRWDAEELMYACRLAKKANYNTKTYSFIGKDLKRTPYSVSGAIHRVRVGKSFIFKTVEASRFKRFIKPTLKKSNKVSTFKKQLPKRQIQTQSGFSINLLWGFLEIKKT